MNSYKQLVYEALLTLKLNTSKDKMENIPVFNLFSRSSKSELSLVINLLYFLVFFLSSLNKEENEKG